MQVLKRNGKDENDDKVEMKLLKKRNENKQIKTFLAHALLQSNVNQLLGGRTFLMVNNRPECFPQKGPKF